MLLTLSLVLLSAAAANTPDAEIRAAAESLADTLVATRRCSSSHRGRSTPSSPRY